MKNQEKISYTLYKNFTALNKTLDANFSSHFFALQLVLLVKWANWLEYQKMMKIQEKLLYKQRNNFTAVN